MSIIPPAKPKRLTWSIAGNSPVGTIAFDLSGLKDYTLHAKSNGYNGALEFEYERISDGAFVNFHTFNFDPNDFIIADTHNKNTIGSNNPTLQIGVNEAKYPFHIRARVGFLGSAGTPNGTIDFFD